MQMQPRNPSRHPTKKMNVKFTGDLDTNEFNDDKSSFNQLCDDIIININQYFLNPADSIRFSLCNKRIRSILPFKVPLQIQILGHGRNKLSLITKGQNFNTFYVSEAHSASQSSPSVTTSTGSVVSSTEPYVTKDQYLKVGIHYHFWAIHVGNSNKRSQGQTQEKGTLFETKLFLGRNERICFNDTPTSHPHRSCRFRLALAECSKTAKCDNGLFPPQTWNIFMNENKKESFESVHWDKQVGLMVGGENTDQFAPNNNNRRVLTTRRGDWNVVVYWWQADEIAFLQKV